MQYQQMKSILDDLAAANSPLVVLVGNNLSAPEMESYIRVHAANPKTVAFGFQATGGRREDGEMICVRKGAGTLHLGLAHSLPDKAVRDALLNAFGNSAYRLAFQPDMDGWYKSHLAFILPVAFLCYSLNCDLTRAGRAQLKQCVDAAGEGFSLLRSLNIPILPKGEDAYFKQGLKRALLTAMLWIAAKTALGRLVASDHCRNAVAEMRALDEGFEAIRNTRPDFCMTRWDALHAVMPGWNEIAQQYEKDIKHA
jgi:2-dehydropantoate 2-reductase